MRQLIITEFVSADGVAEIEKLPSVWNDEMGAWKDEELADSGAMLLGRTTYEIFAGSWPKEIGDFADRFNALPKFVLSSTLKDPDYKPVEVINGPLPEAVEQLKQRSGGNIYVHGSLSVAQQLMRHGLVDRIRLLTHPIVLGQGKPLFAPGVRHELDLISAKRLSNGVLAIEYAPGNGKG